MFLCTVLQPFGRALCEAGKAFFGMEQERGALRGILEIQLGKRFGLSGQFCFASCTSVLTGFSFVFYRYFVAEKEALEKRVKELEESLATRNTEAEKVAQDAAAREAEFVNRVAFLTQNVRGKISICYVHYSTVHRIMLIFAPLYNFLQRQCVFQRLWIRRVTRCRLTRL